MKSALLLPELTLEQFDLQFGEEKPYYEYWEGQAIQKPVPTLLHFYLQIILVTMLREIGLAAAGEVRIKLSSTKQPLPDVIAGERLQHPYPTRGILVAIEILSPQDRASRLFAKLRFYAEQGIPYIYVFDPEERTASRWNAEQQGLQVVKSLEVDLRPTILVSSIWSALDSEVEKIDFT